MAARQSGGLEIVGSIPTVSTIRSLLNGRASGRLPEDGSSILSERTNGRETQRPSTCVTRRKPWVRFPPRPPSRQKVCQLTAGVEKLTGSWGRARTSNGAIVQREDIGFAYRGSGFDSLLLHHPFPEKGVAASVRIGMTRQPGPRSYWQPTLVSQQRRCTRFVSETRPVRSRSPAPTPL